MWHVLVGCILCCWVGQEVNKMQYIEGIENGKSAFMAYGVWFMINLETREVGRGAMWGMMDHFKR